MALEVASTGTRPNELRWYQDWKWLSGVALAVLGLGVTVWFFLIGPSKSTQDSIKRDTQQILARMDSLKIQKQDELIKKYPKGYVLFTIDTRNMIYPSTNSVDQTFLLDWKSASLSVDGQNNFNLRLPDITGKNLVWRGLEVGVSRDMKGAFGAFASSGLAAYVEVIDDQGQNRVLVLGFRDFPSQF